MSRLMSDCKITGPNLPGQGDSNVWRCWLTVPSLSTTSGWLRTNFPWGILNPEYHVDTSDHADQAMWFTYPMPGMFIAQHITHAHNVAILVTKRPFFKRNYVCIWYSRSAQYTNIGFTTHVPAKVRLKSLITINLWWSSMDLLIRLFQCSHTYDD